MNEKNELTVDLFHGTSTIFLNSIIRNGLGGINPVEDWNILELSKEVYELSEKYLKETKIFKKSSLSFKEMAKQSNSGVLNFQHGDTYLSTSKKAAIRYSIHKEYGSELLTYTINFLKELINLEIPYVMKDLYRKHKNIYKIINVNPSPILIQTKNVDVSILLDEFGNDPKDNFEKINTFSNGDIPINFRLKSPIKSDKLTFWLINVTKQLAYDEQYNLYEININNSIKD